MALALYNLFKCVPMYDGSTDIVNRRSFFGKDRFVWRYNKEEIVYYDPTEGYLKVYMEPEDPLGMFREYGVFRGIEHIDPLTLRKGYKLRKKDFKFDSLPLESRWL